MKPRKNLVVNTCKNSLYAMTKKLNVVRNQRGGRSGAPPPLHLLFRPDRREVPIAKLLVLFSPDAGGDYCIRICFLVPTQEVTTALVPVFFYVGKKIIFHVFHI